MARPITERMLGAIRLDAAAYEEIEADQKATGEAAFIVVGTSLLTGAVNGVVTGASAGFAGAIAAFLGWVFYAWVAYIVGVKLFPGPQTKSSWGELARTLGYANTPRFLVIFELVPGFAGVARFVVSGWVLVATIVALRAALDVTTGRAILVAIGCVVAQIVIFIIVQIVIVALVVAVSL
jgi:hypothetical protein